MDKGIKNGINRTNVETSGYAIQEFEIASAADIDGISYFAENVDISIKTIRSYDINKSLIKTECFTYGIVASDYTRVKNIYCVYDDVNFKGIYKGVTLPVTKTSGAWYYIDGNKTIDGESYSMGEILGCLVYGDVSSLRWAKCRIGSDGTLIKK